MNQRSVGYKREKFVFVHSRINILYRQLVFLLKFHSSIDKSYDILKLFEREMLKITKFWLVIAKML